MLTFVIRRVLWTIPVVLVVILVLFLLMRAIGGNPFREGPLFGEAPEIRLSGQALLPEAVQENIEDKYGLNDPWYAQYARYVKGVFTFDLGYSLTFRQRPVTDLLVEQGTRSILLSGLALTWALAFGIPLGVAAALRPGSLLDHGAVLVTSLGIAVPNFLVATVLVYYVSVRWGLLPTSGWGSWRHMVMPVFVLGLLPFAYAARLVRAAAVETLEQDYVRAARARGLPGRRVLAVHVLKNSLIPLVTAAGPLIGFIVTSAFIIENIFAIPGIARHFVSAVEARDYNVVLGLTVTISLVVIIANLVVDILYAFLDPRTRDAR